MSSTMTTPGFSKRAAQLVPVRLRILLIEDQRATAERIGEYFESRDQIMDYAADGQSGLQLALDNTYDVIVLNVGLPKLGGLELSRRYRAEGRTTPILMLTSRDRLEDKLQGFEAGVDDYLTKPFDLRELEARIHVLHRRRYLQPSSVLKLADLTLDCVDWSATRQGKSLHLSLPSYRLLEVLVRNSPHVVSSAELALSLWGDSEHDLARLHTQISLLRRAVDRPFNQSLIVTVNGFGYRMVAPAVSQRAMSSESAHDAMQFGHSAAA